MKLKISLTMTIATILLISNLPFVHAARYNFTPRTSATEIYTDNVFLTDKNTEDDWLTDVSAGFTFQALGKTRGLDLSFDPAYVWYSQGSKDDTWRLPASVSLWSNISKRTRLSLYDRFLRTEDPQGNETVVSDDGRVVAPGDSSVRRGRQPYYTNYAVGRIDHQFDSDDSVYVQFLTSLLRNDESNANDNDRYSPSAGLTYWFGPKWGSRIDAEFTRAEFDNSPDYDDISGTFQLMRRFTRHFQVFGRYGYAYRDNDVISDYQVHAPSAGIIYDVAADSRITVGLGYYYQDFSDSDIGSEQAPFVNGELYKRWNYRRFSAMLLGNGGLDRNDFGSERLGFEYFAGISGDARYNFTRNFYGNVVGRYRYGDFINRNRKDNRYRLGAGLGWLPTRWMRVTLGYFFNKLYSTGAEDYDENRVMLRFTFQPDKPWRW